MPLPRQVMLPLAAAAGVACGGGGTGPTEPAPNFVRLQSDAGDFIGGGQSYNYTQANALLTLTASGGHLLLIVTGDQSWRGEFQLPSSRSGLEPGTYADLPRYPSTDPITGSLSWSGEGHSCNTLLGSLVIDSVSYSGGNLSAVDLRFEQRCEGSSATLHGTIHWRADDTTMPPGPVNPIPANLWQPAPGSTPAAGNYVYLESAAGDYVGGGRTATYTQANAVLIFNTLGSSLSISIQGDEQWFGTMQPMNALTRFQPGYYPELRRYPFHNPVRGGISWDGNGNGCNTLTGWLAIDQVSYANGVLTALDLRFEQHCEANTAPLRGAVHWRPGDTTAPPGPVLPIPAGLWQPAAGSTPANGNYVYLASEPGDYVGQGRSYSFSPSNAVIFLNAPEGHLLVTVSGPGDFWQGDFEVMNTLTRFQPGYYPALHRYPFNNPAKGGLAWFGNGAGCNLLTGWFVVDSVTYSNGNLTSIHLRFEQHCEGGTPALHGMIDWTG